MEKYGKQAQDDLKLARAIHDEAEKAGVDLTGEKLDQFNSHMSNVEKFKAKQAQLDKLEAVESSFKESAGRISKPQELHNEIEKYSVVRAMRMMVNDHKLSGLEAEVNQEIFNKTGKSPNGFYVPWNMEKYGNLDTSTGSGALNTVVDYSNFIELLRKKTLMNQLGARILTDLNGTISIPKQTGGASSYWINANGSATITDSNQAVSQVPLAPSQLGARTKYTKAFLDQTSMDVENFVRDDLATVIAIELDRVGFNGSGSGAEPEGLLQNSSVTTVELDDDGGFPTFAKMVEQETAVAVGNADIGTLNYVTTAAGRGVMKSTPVVSGHSRMIWENNQVNGYGAFATNQLPSNLTKGYGTNLSSSIFGNYNDCLYGFWGGLDVVVDPYTAAAGGSIIITMIQSCDFAIRHVESFSKIIDLKTAA